MPTVNIDIKMGDKWKLYLQKLSKVKAEMRVGFLGGDTYPDGTSVAEVAAINEYGKGRNPERPFVGETVKEHMPRWRKIIETNVKDDFSQANVMRAYELAGQDAEGKIRERIKRWPTSEPQPNAAATIARKKKRGKDGKGTEAINPEQVLIDTAVMINAIRHEVKGG